jgi:hypothetical protein
MAGKILTIGMVGEWIKIDKYFSPLATYDRPAWYPNDMKGGKNDKQWKFFDFKGLVHNFRRSGAVNNNTHPHAAVGHTDSAEPDFCFCDLYNRLVYQKDN